MSIFKGSSKSNPVSEVKESSDTIESGMCDSYPE